jgi:hypothetical protein
MTIYRQFSPNLGFSLCQTKTGSTENTSALCSSLGLTFVWGVAESAQ